MSSIQIKYFSENDLTAIKKILQDSNLPVVDIVFGKQDFLVAWVDSEIVGSIALERYEKNAILRSFAVKEAFRNQKIGELLYKNVISYCKENGIEQLYLLTTTPDQYFKKLGWEVIDRTEVPEEISLSTEFSSVCPSISICMNLKIKLYE